MFGGAADRHSLIRIRLPVNGMNIYEFRSVNQKLVYVVRWMGVFVPRHTIHIYRPFLHFRSACLEFYFFRSQSTVVASPDATYEKPQIAIGFCFAEAQVCSYAARSITTSLAIERMYSKARLLLDSPFTGFAIVTRCTQAYD